MDINVYSSLQYQINRSNLVHESGRINVRMKQLKNRKFIKELLNLKVKFLSPLEFDMTFIKDLKSRILNKLLPQFSPYILKTPYLVRNDHNRFEGYINIFRAISPRILFS